MNEGLLQGDEADISKMSYAVLPDIRRRYRVLPSGSALGRGNGPLLVSAKALSKKEMTGLCVAVPGKYTTASLLLRKFFPGIGCTRECLFSDVADAVLKGETEAGVLIHEGRFTYEEKGLNLVADLGREWETSCGLPLPLGGIVVSRRLPEDVQRKAGRVLRRSIEYALEHPSVSYDFVKRYAQEMDDDVIDRHIGLFVNHYSLDLGEEGRQAVQTLLSERMKADAFADVFVG